MNIVIAGSRVQVYGEDVQTYKELPLGSYDVCFNKMTGFFLSPRHELTITEEKVYGSHEEKVAKVLRSYENVDRNFGIILSGQKGIGKSLFAKILANRGIEKGYPIITVSIAVPGIADFIASIEQEVIVIFDEFEKVFSREDDCDPQEEMLSLFDGIDCGKKLFVITCNEVNRLNSYLLNRPGRFHYHFVIGNPTEEEVREYMTDKLLPQYHGIIEKIVDFSKTINITYDYLRAIVFEVNQGYSLEETLGDLNITRTSDLTFNVTVLTAEGENYKTYSERIDLYSDELRSMRVYSPKGDCLYFMYRPSDFHIVDGELMITSDQMNFRFDEDDYYDEEGGLTARQQADKDTKEARSKFKGVILEKNSYSNVNRYLV